MKIGSEFYLITGKKLNKIVEEAWKERKRIIGSWNKFAKSVGATNTLHVVDFGDSKKLRGFNFVNPPDQTIWRRKDDCWVPRLNTKKGKLLKATCPIGEEVSFAEVAKAVGWKNMYNDSHYYTFNFFYCKGKAGFTVPIFYSPAYIHHPELRYKPVPGVKEITIKAYQKMFE